MGKVVKPLLIATAIAVNVIPGAGQAISAALSTALLGSAAAGALAIAGVSATAFTAAITAAGVAAGISEVTSALAPNPKIALGQLDRLSASVNPATGRKMVLGENVAMATDIRYVEPSGTDQEYIDYIIVVAAHKVAAIRQIWLDDRKAWDSGTVQSDFTGYLEVNTRLEGTSANTIAINGGTKWGSTRRLTGCAYVHLRIKRTGNSKKAESPFAGGLTNRITIIGDGMPVYDPRLDSTVGGSGSQRADDCSTWSFNSGGAKQGANTALQALAVQLGWKIAGKTSVGAGTPPGRINFDDYITAANQCDESVTTSSGSQKRYTSQGVFSENDGPQTTLSALMQSCNGAMRDTGGKLGIRIRHNDLASIAVDLTEDDILGPGTWEPFAALPEAYNVVRGRFCDPSTSSLYQLIDYPEIRLSAVDGQDRILTLDLPLVDNAARAQRIAKQVLQRLQYRGKFTAPFSARAWKAKVGDVVRVTLGAVGWSNKLFRVESQVISMTGQCQMVLREENAAIYQWDADDRAPVTAAAPTVYDPLNDPLILAIDEALQSAVDAIAAAENAQDTADGKIDTFYQNSPPAVASEGDLWFDTNDTNKLYTRRSGAWVLTADTRVALAITNAAGAQATADGKVTTFYSTSTPTATALGDLWYNASTEQLRRWNGSSWLEVATVGANWSTNLDAIPTAIGDGRVDAGLNADGTVKPNRVSTTAVVDNSFTKTFGATTATALYGSGAYAWQDLVSYTVNMTVAGDLLLWGDIQNAYASGTLPQAWQIRFTVDGTQIGSPKGGAGWGTDSSSIQRIATGLSAGNRTVKLQWRADNSALSCGDGTIFGMGRFNK